MSMNVTLPTGYEVNGYKITARAGLHSYVAENDQYRINFHTEAGTGINRSKVLTVYNKNEMKMYTKYHQNYKFIPIVQSISNHLFGMYKTENGL